MGTGSDFHEYAEEIEKLLRLKTYPLAVKLLKSEEDIPNGVKRPLRDWGYHLALCQAISISRRDGTPIAMLKEDNWCFLPVVGLGLAEAPQYFLDGYSYFPRSVQTLEIGKLQARAFSHLEFGKYIGVVLAPLRTTNFEPDLVMIYCDSAQLTQLIMAKQYTSAEETITCKISANAVCVYAIVPVIQNRQYQIAVPCPGDRYRAMAQDDEMVFAAPKENLEALLVGLRNNYNQGVGLNKCPSLLPDFELYEPYAKIAKMLGMKKDT